MYIDELTFMYPIEQGGYSIVWKVRYNNKYYALKMISKDKYKTKIQKKMLKTEIKIHKPLRHENIIKLYNSFEDDFFLYILLELGEEDLFNYMDKYDNMKMKENEAIDIAYQIAKGLSYLNDQNVIHGDLKLENILLIGKKAKICDFGLSSQNFYHYSYIGTPEFMAPEIIQKKMYDNGIDIWSYGVMLFYMIYGFSPFYTRQSNSSSIDSSKTEHKICHTDIPFPEDDDKILVQDLIKKCLTKNAKDRINVKNLLNHSLFNKFRTIN